MTWNRLHPAQLAEGASLLVDVIDEIHPPIRTAAEALERFIGTPVQTNAYASWTEQEGFGGGKAEEADQVLAALAEAETDWQEWLIVRQRIGEILSVSRSGGGLSTPLSLHAAWPPVGGTGRRRPSHPRSSSATLPATRPLARANGELSLEY